MTKSAKSSKKTQPERSESCPIHCVGCHPGISIPGFKSSSVSELSKKEAMQIYHDMLLIRRFEEKAGQLYGMGLIGGFCHLYIGQEAVVVGFKTAMKDKDTIITTYRDHGHMLACGMDAKGVMAELTGRSGGYSKGKGGSMHMFSKEKNFYGGHGIVGASVSLGAGLAFTHKYLGDGGVNLCFFGDGAANQGQVYETFNMASLWKLPIVFIIENNHYAMGTSQTRHAANEALYTRGEGFGIPGFRIDGMNVQKVRDAAAIALDYVRKGNGPILLEVETYRYRGHSMSDPATYRSKDEVECYRKNLDSIINFREFMLVEELATENDFEKIEDEVKAIVKEAADFAQISPEPDASELWTDVLIER